MELTLGERIRKSRKGKMTQAELANAIGVHEITIRRWESGERTPDVKEVQKLSQVLCVPMSDLLNESLSDIQPVMMNATKENTSHEKNAVMAAIILDNGRRIEAPATKEGYAFLKEVFAMSLGKSGTAIA